MSQEFAEYNLAKGAYASFDAITLKEFIKERLTETSIFTDQNYEGSNLAAITDIFAFAYHILLFYYNQTASESIFDQSELYENMNKIVKAVGYKPTGPRTSAVTFTAAGDDTLPINTYTIKRYSSINFNGFTYTFTKDATFEKTLSGAETLSDFAENNLIYQGTIVEYPDYTAIGEDNEVLTIIFDSTEEDAKFIDFDNIDVYVENASTGEWSQWEEVDSLFLSKSTDKVFDKRVNENGRYELKFGNNINGKRLSPGDIVSVFYLLSDGDIAILDQNLLSQASSITEYRTTKFDTLQDYIYDSDLTFLSPNLSQTISIDNPIQSTLTSTYEDVDSIKSLAPKLFTAQNRAVSITDYNAFIEKKFNNILQSFKVVSNETYLGGYMNYFYDIGLSRPNENTNVLTNQVLYADACDFNNVYIFAVPKVGAILDETTPNAIPVSQKNAIHSQLQDVKMITNEIVISDPIYTAFDFGVDIATNEPRTLSKIRDGVKIEIEIDSQSRISKEAIKNSAITVIKDFFKVSNNSLGQLVDLSILSRTVLSIEGVISISTKYTHNDKVYTVPGFSFVTWNPQYPEEDIAITTQTISLPYFKFPFLFEESNLSLKIDIIRR
jgi:hypothetical protein